MGERSPYLGSKEENSKLVSSLGMTVLFCQQTLSCTKITKRMCKRTGEPRLFKAVNKESNTKRTNIEELRWTYSKHGTEFRKKGEDAMAL